MSSQKPVFQEKRKNPRIKSVNAVKYALYDENGKRTVTGDGETIDFSQGGALLKTPTALRGTIIVLMTIDLEGQKVKVQGRVVRTATSKNTDGFLSGIEFTGTGGNKHKDIVAFFKAHHHRKSVADLK